MKDKNEDKKPMLIHGIDSNLLKQFKISCTMNDTTMKEAIIWYIEKYGWKGLSVEISDGERSEVFENLFVGLEEMFYEQDCQNEITIKAIIKIPTTTYKEE